MKTVVLLLMLCCVCFVQKTKAQPNGILADSTVVFKHKLWLYNSSGKIVADQDSVISKEYFRSKWVDMQSEAPFWPNAKFICILQANETHAMVFYLEQTKLTAEVLKGIKEWPIGGSVMFIAEEKNDETGIKEMRGLKLILEQ